MTSTTRTTVSTSVNWTSWTEARIVSVRSVTTSSSTPAGIERCEPRQQRLDAVDGLDDVGAGLTLDVDDHRGLAVEPAGELGVFEAVDDGGDVAEPHRARRCDRR